MGGESLARRDIGEKSIGQRSIGERRRRTARC